MQIILDWLKYQRLINHQVQAPAPLACFIKSQIVSKPNKINRFYSQLAVTQYQVTSRHIYIMCIHMALTGALLRNAKLALCFYIELLFLSISLNKLILKIEKTQNARLLGNFPLKVKFYFTRLFILSFFVLMLCVIYTCKIFIVINNPTLLHPFQSIRGFP